MKCGVGGFRLVSSVPIGLLSRASATVAKGGIPVECGCWAYCFCPDSSSARIEDPRETRDIWRCMYSLTKKAVVYHAPFIFFAGRIFLRARSPRYSAL